MCTFDRAGCKDGSVLAAGGAAIRGSSGRSSEYYGRVPDRNSFATKSSGRTFVMYHGTTWRNWQRIKQHGFLLSNSASGLGEGVYLTRSERKAEFYRKSKWGVIVKVRVELGKMVTINRQGHHLQKSWQMAGYDSAAFICTCRGNTLRDSGPSAAMGVPAARLIGAADCT